MIAQYIVCTRCMTFNHANFIKEAMDGFCMQQTDFPFVCCIVDDASTDGEPDIIKNYICKNFDVNINSDYRTEETDDYSFVFARHKKNLNCFFAVYLLKYNHWKKKSKMGYISKWFDNSTYIALCEGDDYWIRSDKLQKQVDFMESHPECSLCCHNAYRESAETGRRMGTHKIYNHSQYAERLHVFRDGGFLPTLSLLYRNELFGSDFEKFPRNKAAGDIKIQSYAAIVGKVYYINEVMGVYRLNIHSVTHKAMVDNSIAVNRQNLHIDWYRRVDDYTNKKYHEEIDKSIAFCEARIIRLQGEYTKLWIPRYWPYLRDQKWSTRLGLFVAMMGLSFVPEIGKKVKRLFQS